MTEGANTFEEGDELTIGGDRYEVAGVDPRRDGVRAYYLDDGTDASVRLEPQARGREFVLVDVRIVGSDDVEVADGG